VLSDNGNEFRPLPFGRSLKRLGTRHSRIHAGRPQTNGQVETLLAGTGDRLGGDASAREAAVVHAVV
jgi:transposase InsO family protein